MAKKKKKGYKGKNWYRSYSFSLQLQGSRTTRRRTAKYRRAPNYWISHDDLTFSKVILKDVEKLWLELHAPDAVVEFKMVNKPEQFPRYRKGLWDGMAYFVTFKTTSKASVFKAAMWNFRG